MSKLQILLLVPHCNQVSFLAWLWWCLSGCVLSAELEFHEEVTLEAGDPPCKEA